MNGFVQRQNVVQHGTQSIDIAAVVNLQRFSGGLLGRHERWCAKNLAIHRLGHVRLIVVSLGLHSPIASFVSRRRLPRHDLGQTPIDDQNLTEFTQHDVFGFQVTVDNFV